MSLLPVYEFDKISFDDWVKGVFNWPEKEAPWYHGIDIRGPLVSPKDSLHFLRQLFGGSSSILQQFSNLQVERGLQYIIDPGFSNEILCFLENSLPLRERVEAIDSIYLLFQDCLSKRCSNYLSHIDESRENPLNKVCYMWWDVAPLVATGGKIENKETDIACLNVMRKILSLENEACRESALHGLGHAQLYYPAEVKKIVDAFIATNLNIRQELLSYAKSARLGMVQ